ncbi:MAG: helix-turn-helix domain-containing protein [Sandaracinaceae bacterium]
MSEDETTSLLNARFRRLIEELGAERGHKRGWKARVAEELGLTPAHLTRIVKGQRGVSLDSAKRAAAKLGFGMAYFVSGEASDSVSYRDFLTSSETFILRSRSRSGGTRHEVLSDGMDADRRELHRKAVALLRKVVEGQATREMVDDLAESVHKLPLFSAASEVFHHRRVTRQQAIYLAAQVLAFTGGDLEEAQLDLEFLARDLAGWEREDLD